MSYDTPSPREEESGSPDDKVTDDGVPTDDALPVTRPTNPNGMDPEDPDKEEDQ
jgi:hypothetical protein